MDESAPLRLAPPELSIGDHDGFDRHDLFQAKAAGERLASIVGDLVGHSVLIIDGPWGSGKSVFVKQWAGLLRQRGHPVVYFDSFEHDHLADAFFPLFAHLLQAHASEPKPLQAHRANLVKTATSLAKAMPSVLLDVALRKTTGGMLTLPALREELSQTAASQPETTEGLIADHIEHIDHQFASIRHFRETLKEAVASICESDDLQAPLVFVVDELDRCKPSYALNVLERIKHLFSVDDVCFVLVTHLDGLSDMVSREYGLKRAKRYLDKFHHLRFDIESLLTSRSRRTDEPYLDSLLDGYGLHSRYSDGDKKVLANLIRIHEISLRSQERILLNIALMLRATSTNTNWLSYRAQGEFTHLGIVLCVLRHHMPDLYRNAANQVLEYPPVHEFLRIDQWADLGPDFPAECASLWKLATLQGTDHMTEEEKTERGSLLPQRSASYRRLLANVCAHIDQIWQ